MKVMVTGGAGFVGSHLVDALLLRGHEVTVYDNFTTGRVANLAQGTGRLHMLHGDILDANLLAEILVGMEMVYHVAASADIRHNLAEPARVFKINTQGTFRLLEAMRHARVKRIAFTSTSSIYGETAVHPTPEDAPFPVQTSLYGASKAAGEALIQAYCEGYGFTGYITRHIGMIGERYTHGHLIDFYHCIRNTGRLQILGDGTLKKNYLYVGDAVRGILTAVEKGNERLNIYNVGGDEIWTVRQSAEAVCEEMGLPLAKLSMGAGTRGWVGDNSFMHLDASRLRSLGWEPKVSVREAIGRTIAYFKEQHETARA